MYTNKPHKMPVIIQISVMGRRIFRFERSALNIARNISEGIAIFITILLSVKESSAFRRPILLALSLIHI